MKKPDDIYMNDKVKKKRTKFRKEKPILEKIGTLKFDTKEQALEQLDIRLKKYFQ